jgi:hypothetical protein
MHMSKKNNTKAKQTLTPEQKEEQSKKHYIKKRNSIWFWAVILIVALLAYSARNIVGTYYYAFVVRDGNITSAMAGIDDTAYTSTEEAVKADLLSQWDSYSNSRLRDTVSTTAQDGVVLNGYYYDNGSDVTVVALHRYDGSGTDEFLYASYFEHYNLLLPDARDHGSSGGEVCTFGYLESQDVASWLDWIDETLGDQQVILYGEDLGAVSALMADDAGLLEGRVAFILAESPYTSLTDWAEYSMAHWFKIPKFMTKLMGVYADYKGVMDYRQADALTQAGEGTTPVLFLVGEDNNYVPTEESLAVYEAWGGEKELLSLSGRNGLIYAKNTQEIQNTLDQWVATYLHH